MKKLAFAAALGVGLTGPAVHAQTLQPQMSTQQLTTEMQVVDDGIIVPILTMIFIVIMLAGGSTGVYEMPAGF